MEFNCPLGLCIDESNGNIYICNSATCRIQIFFFFNSQIGSDTRLSS